MNDRPAQNARAGDTREAFLAPIREALERKATLTPPQPPQVDESIMRLASWEDDLVDMFCRQAEAVSMIVHRVSADDAVAKVLALLQAINARRIVLAAGPTADELPTSERTLQETLTQAGIEVIDGQTSPGFEPQYDLDAGVTDVHAALAETGTLICTSDASHSRGFSLIPPNHIALVRKQDILPDMIDYWQRAAGLPPEERPSSISFITGPSKTADIEGQLIQGVHGPGRVDVVLIT